MDDRELLERAASAAGFTPCGWLDFTGLTDWHGADSGIEVEENGGPWNPLENDGDAFRLMVDAEIVVASAYGEIMATHDEVTAVTGPLGDDPYATARRAIVSAAANKVKP